MREFEAARGCTPSEYMHGRLNPLKGDDLLIDDLFILMAAQKKRGTVQAAVQTPIRLEQLALNECGLYYFTGSLLDADFQPQEQASGIITDGLWSNPRPKLSALVPPEKSKMPVHEAYFKSFKVLSVNDILEAANPEPISPSRSRRGRPPLA